jgi:hypothetical protein
MMAALEGQMRTTGLVIGVLLTACGEKEEGGDDASLPAGDADTDVDIDDTETGDTGFLEYLDVIALGFEYRGIWNQETGDLEPYLYPDLYGTNGAPFALLPIVEVKLASLEYFEGSTDVPDEYCSFLTLFSYFPSDAVGTEFNWDVGDGGTGVDLETWSMVDGFLTILPDSLDDRCYELDPEVWPGGDPYDYIDGMHFGMGHGPLSPYLIDWLGPFDTTTSTNPYDYSNAYMSQFIAINHPGSGGSEYTFPAYDWNTALLVETDHTECVSYEYTTTTYVYDVCGMIGIDDELGVYIPGDVREQPIHGFVTGNSAWLEDTPNLDLSILKLGGVY